MRLRIIALMAVMAVMALPAIAGAQENATVIVVHGIPGAEVNVTAGGDAIIENFTFQSTETLDLPAGTYPIGVSLTDGTEVYAEADVTVEAGKTYVAIAHLDADGNPAAGLFVEEVNTASIAAGEARLTAYHMAAAPAVDILTGETVLFDAVPNGASGNIDVPADTYPVVIAADADNSVVAFEGDVALAEGANTLVFAIGSLADENFGPVVEVVSGLGESPEGVPSGEGPLGALDATLAMAALAAGAVALGFGRVLSRRGA